MTRRPTKDWLDEANNEHTNLTMFYAIIAMTENGLFYGADHEVALERIRKICRKEADRCLVRLNRAAAVVLEDAALAREGR